METVQITTFYLKARFGKAVQVKYVDMADPENQAQYPELMAVIQERGLPYPLVAVNGRVRVAGSVDYYRLLPLIEEALAEIPEPVTA